MITLQIKTGQINKEWLYKGKNATYLNLVLFPSQNDPYGNDWIVKQSLSKEQRAAGVKAPIIGNGKNMGGSKPTTGGEDVL